MTQVQERDVQFVVRHEIADREPVDIEAINDPINQLGPLHSDCVPIVTSNDPASYLAAVNKRSNFLQDGPDDDVGAAEFAESLKIWDEMPHLFDTWEENDFDRERWLNKFDDAKRARMVHAWANIDVMTKRELTSKTGSVKIEALNGKRFEKGAAGRIIYAGTDAFNAVTGPPQMVMMERLVTLLGSEGPDGKPVTLGEINVMLGYKTDDIACAAFIKDDRYKNVVEGDFSRNDREQRKKVAHIIDKACEVIEMPVWYRQMLLQLEVYTLSNMDFGIRVHLMYQLATGTTNTTFRNSVYNATMFAVICRRQKRFGKALILGDDLLAALNKRLDLKEWVADVARFKMVLKAKSPELDGEATFLSRRIFADVEVPFMVPLLGKMLVRFNCRANQNSALSDSAAMAAKALSYAFGCKNVHVLRDIFMARFELEGGGDSFDVTELGWMARTNGYTVDSIKEQVRNAPNLVDDDQFSLWTSSVYDLDICEVVELFEMTILSTECTILDHPNIEKMRKDYE